MATRSTQQTVQSYDVQAIRAAARALREQRGPQPATGQGVLLRAGVAYGDIINGFGDAVDAYRLKRQERLGETTEA